jgi:patatin-related protein
MTAPFPTVASAPSAARYTHEVRFGVVMYGGVSLAIYINGVANELYELCRATPKDGGPADETGSRAVYRKLSWLLRNEHLRAAYLHHLRNPGSADPFAAAEAQGAPERTRFVVDVIAGTSAGGINGIFLAKALANGEAFGALKQLWVQEGDIASLLNDRRSWRGLEFADSGRPTQSLLNSDRMYLKLVQAMESMAPAVPSPGGGESALADEVDLYVTTTDIRGALVPMRLFDKVVYEKRHKQVFHFQYRGSGGHASRNDFVGANTPFLAFAARCTSSFPFAFEPMQIADAERLTQARPGGGGVRFDGWKPFLKGLSADDLAGDGWRTRAFGDGGYLDNKPFSYVVEALSWRLGALPMDRKLVYVEPAPAHPEKDAQAGREKPNAIDNALAALTSIPQYETIREDLDAVLKRNRRIERVERLVRRVESDVEGLDEDPFARVMVDEQGRLPNWSDLDLKALVRYYGVAFLPYRRLRVITVTDDVADRMAARWGVDRGSDRHYAMRALVRAWREEHYYDNRDEAPADPARPMVSVNRFLEEFDVQYRLRRVSFLLRRTHQIMRLASAHGGVPREGTTDIERAVVKRLGRYTADVANLSDAALSAALVTLRDGFARAIAELRRAAYPADTPEGRPEALRAQLQEVLRLLIQEPTGIEQLNALDGAAVPLAKEELPPPSATRTLQENVLARAKGLFRIARAGRRTVLQDALEADIEAVRGEYAQFTSALAKRTPAVPLVRELLGQPQLRVARQPDDPTRHRIEVEVGPVEGAGREALNTPEGTVLRRLLAEYYLRFDEYDQVSFPLYYDTGTGEPATVEVVRVSPEDAPSLIDEGRDARRKLAGTFFHNFGGFLDEAWRKNDILWGRLDGCERLLQALLPAQADAEVRAALLAEAQRAIVREELPAERLAELLATFAKALGGRRLPDVDTAFSRLWAAIADTDDQRAARLGLALRTMFDDHHVLDYVKQSYEVRRTLDPQPTLETVSRAVTITGRILEQIERTQGGRRAVWITRGGRVLQSLIAVAVPGSLLSKLWTHGLTLLYLFELFIAAAGAVLAEPAVRNAGLAAFAITLGVHGVSLLLGDVLQRRWRVRVATLVIASVAALGLAGFGLVGLVQVGAKTMLCGVAQDASGSGGGRWWCR